MRASNDAVVHFAALGAPWLPAGRFPDGAESIGLPSIGEWQAILSYTGHDGRLLAVDPNRYPRHFRVLSGFHRERSRLPRASAVRPLDWGGSPALPGEAFRGAWRHVWLSPARRPAPAEGRTKHGIDD